MGSDDCALPMAERIRLHDWSATPLGPMERWPQSLRTVVDLLLSSRYAMWMGWGRELTFLWNDAYNPTLGLKSPWALGMRADQVWAEVWAPIGPRLDAVLAGVSTYDEGLLLFLERSGFPEETYHTFSYSPIRVEGGRVGGTLCVVTEVSEALIAERRVEILRSAAAALAVTNTEEEVFKELRAQLDRTHKDLPFTLVYLFDEQDAADLVCRSGMEAGDPLAPSRLQPGQSFPWPAAGVLAHPAPLFLDDLSAQRELGPLPANTFHKPPDRAVVVPIKQQGQEGPAGFVVAGVSPFRRYDADYEGFIGLLAGQIAAALANARAYAAERKRAEALAELDRAKTEFFSNVSHEFRTPLTLMLGPLEELQAKPDSELPPGGAGLVRVVHRNGLRLLKLVNSLLDFSRLEAGRANALFEPVDLARLTADLASSFRSAVEKAGLLFEIDCPEMPEPFYVDREMYEKVILNLLSNALKFTLEGGICVRTRMDERDAEIAVADTGAGIPESELGRIFTRFHRVRGAVGRTHEGTGIGLALVREIVRQHGGSIRVESRPGQGSTFTISIPRGKAHLPADRIGAENAPASKVRADAWVEEALQWTPASAPEARPAQDPEAARVYIAEDNADMREYLRRLLETRYLVSVFPDGAEALAAARQNPPDLLLSDVMMPRMDGFELLKAVRGDERLSGVRVILLSARAGEESKVEGLDAGADDYLVKPFTTAELIARVRAHVEMSRSRKAAEERLREAQKLESIGLLAGGVAHDFNNLLVGVLGNASLLMEVLPPSETGYALAESIVRAGQAAANLTRQLLAYAGKGQIVIRRVDLQALIRETRGLLDATIPKEIRLDLEFGPGVAAVEGDPTQIQQLVMNLVLNSAEAIGDHRQGRIRVATSAMDGQTVLEVSDNGEGMPPEVAARVFEPFFTTKFTGRGLGLAAVQGIVRAHRGSMQLRTAPGEGTAFRIAFPALDEPAEESGAQVSAPMESPGTGTILVVDDEPIVRKVAQAALGRTGYQVVLAESGDDALEYLAANARRVDLVLLDWAMPGKNGEETLAGIRRLRVDVPVVLSSGFSHAEVSSHFPDLAGFIQKPYTVSQLSEAVGKALEAARLVS